MEYTDIGTVTFLRVLILWVPELENWGRMVSKWIVWGRAVSCLHNQAPNWNTIDFLRWNTWHQVQWHYYVYWFCECQSSTTGGRWSPNELCGGEQSHAYIIKHPISTTIDSLWWNTLTSGTVIPTCIDSVSARAAQLEDGWSPNELCGGEQSHAYIIKHPISTQLTPCDGIHSHQVQWHTTCMILWVPEQHNWRTDVSKELCEESSLMLT